MQELDRIYTNLLSIGLVHTRSLLHEGRLLEARLEIDHLYAIPQLIGSLHRRQHQFYLNDLRARFVDGAGVEGAERLLRHIKAHYFPIWADLEAAVAQLPGHPAE